jgi:hypothetical protein
METGKMIIKALLVLITLSALIYLKYSNPELRNWQVLTLDGMIVILLLSMAQKALLTTVVLLPVKLFGEVKKFFKGPQAR